MAEACFVSGNFTLVETGKLKAGGLDVCLSLDPRATSGRVRGFFQADPGGIGGYSLLDKQIPTCRPLSS